jgi:hypothetical protein
MSMTAVSQPADEYALARRRSKHKSTCYLVIREKPAQDQKMRRPLAVSSVHQFRQDIA